MTLIDEEAIPRFRDAIMQYERIFGFRPEVYPCKPAGGARILEHRG